MTILTVEFLKKYNACQSGIDFCINNKLIGYPLDKINEIQGDYRNYISWLKSKLNVVEEYDSNNSLIYYKNNNGYEYWKEYDSNNNVIHFKNNDGYEEWKTYDSNNNLIYKKDNNEEETNIIT